MYRYNTPNTPERSKGGNTRNRDSPGVQGDVILPKLPPLNTRSSFLESDMMQSDVSIGWTPLTENTISTSGQFADEHIGYGNSPQLRSPKSPANHRNSLIYENFNGDSPMSVKSVGNGKSRRRPPPPSLQHSISQLDSYQSSPGSPATPFITKRRTNDIITPTKTKPYKSPFVGEQDIEDSMSQQSTHFAGKVYKSPFVGDLDSDIIISPSNGNEITKTRKESSRVQSKTISNTELNFYSKPQIPLTSSRNITGISRFSDQVESFYSDSNYTFNNSSARNSSFNSFLGAKPLQYAPSVTAPTQAFSIDLIDEHKLYQCYSIYRLSDIYEWLLKVYFEWFNEYIFEKLDLFQIVQLLLEFQSPKTYEQEVIDSNVDRIMSSLINQGAIKFEVDNEQEIAVIVAGLTISSIFTDLLPCYSFIDSTFNEFDHSTICYSTTCCNRLSNESRQEIKVSEIINKSVGLWTDYWQLSAEELSEINPKEIQRQSFIFDLIILEERSLSMANAAVEIYGKRFDPDLLPDETNFASLAFDIFLPIIEIHKEFILKPLFWKIKTRGKFIDGIGKIYLKWCHEVRDAYLNYANAMATVHEVISWEKTHHTKFAEWLLEIDNLPEITRSKMYHDVIFFGGYFKSLQNMPVTLSSILKNTSPSSEDYGALQLVIKEVTQLSADVDKVHGMAIDRRKLIRFSKQLVYSSGNKGSTTGYINIGNPEKMVKGDKLSLGLADPKRVMINCDTVLKRSDHWLEPYPVFLALLDNFLLITELVSKGLEKKYKLIDRPIPIEYLNLEIKRAPEEFNKDLPLGDSRPTSQIVSDLDNKSSLNSRSSVVGDLNYGHTGISNNLPSSTEFAFKVRNTATNDSYTFYVPNSIEWNNWMNAFKCCFKNRNNDDNRHPINLSIITAEFSYQDRNAPVNLPVAPEGSEIDSALKTYKRYLKDEFENIATTVFCSTEFDNEDTKFNLIATNSGVFLRRKNDYTTKFVKVLQNISVSRLQAVPKLGLLFVLDGQKLCYFSISSILAVYYNPERFLNANFVVGIVLKDKVSFFKFADDFGNSKQLFYERKGKIVVSTPEFHSIMNNFNCFKIYKKYYLPSSSKMLASHSISDIVIFKKSFMVFTKKNVFLFNDAFNELGASLPGFYNDKEMIAYIKHPHLNSGRFSSSSSKLDANLSMVTDVKKDIASGKTKPITAFRLQSGDGFLMVYDEAIVKINSSGMIPNWKNDILILDFYCTGASYHNGYLFLIGENLILVYQLSYEGTPISELTPVQIINSKKIELLNSGGMDYPTVTSSHPKIPNRQLLFSCIPANYQVK
ncbi:hypothetical protein B1J92_J04752g [Nakaseomyces glabratus]|nr:hypothetical protein B1J91_J04752g [Nakaseomyces glabratus]OXB47361.1 hypothetical protein B1J92_J04752g [Nakaseomyces glabratus]